MRPKQLSPLVDVPQGPPEHTTEKANGLCESPSPLFRKAAARSAGPSESLRRSYCKGRHLSAGRSLSATSV
eukprot:634154-Alexandrium_andersonii.AAC.1